MKEWAEELPSDTVRIDRALLGIPIQLFCKKGEVEGAISKATACWQSVSDPAASPISIGLDFTEDPSPPGPASIEVRDQIMSITGAGIECHADAQERSAQCIVPRSWLDYPSDLLAEILEPAVLFLLTRNGRTPVHASGILLGGHAILFTGPSGSGKSSLALAAHRAGLQVLSEDTVYIQSEPNFAVWGWDGPVHLLAKDSADASAKVRIRNGRAKHVLYLERQASLISPARTATLCILRRGSLVSLTAVSEAEAKVMVASLEPGFDLLRRQIYAAQDLLCCGGAWQLELSDSPTEAISLVISLVAQGAGALAP